MIIPKCGPLRIVFAVFLSLLFVFFLLPFGSYLFLNALLDADTAQVMAGDEFELQNPGLESEGGRMLYYDPLAYTMEVRGYGRSGGVLIPAEKEIYRVYWWGAVAKSENAVTKFLPTFALFYHYNISSFSRTAF